MNEREQQSLPPREIQSEYRTAKVSAIIGAIIGVGGAIADYNLVSANADRDTLLWVTVTALFGACLVVNGAERYAYTRQAEKRQIEDAENMV